MQKFIYIIIFIGLACKTPDSGITIPKENDVIQKPKPKVQPESIQEETLNYDPIDIHALNAPAGVEKDISTLVRYLIQPAKNEKEKTRAIFRWISDRIKYDTVSFFSGNYQASDANSVLQSRSSVCEGYANLFNAMAEKAGLESQKITGFSKGYGYTPGKVFSKSDHAWNSVKINGKWYLLDSTWAAGYVNGKSFEKRFEDFYFLTPPERFINDHLPEQEKWQLLNPPVSMSDFSEAIKKQASFYKLGLSKVSPSAPVLKAKDSLKLRLEGKENLVFLASLNESKDYTFIESENGKYNVLVKSPGKGKYKLSIFAKDKASEGMYSMILEYDLEFQSGTPQNMFVKKYPVDSYLHSPRERYLDSGKEYEYKIDVPGARSLAFIDSSGEWTKVESKNESFSYRGKFPKGELKVSANFGEKSWPVILVYQIK